MSLLDEVVMLVVAIAIASVVLLAFLIWLYLWAIRRSRQREDGPFEEDRSDIP